MAELILSLGMPMRRALGLAVIVILSGVLPLIASARMCGGKSCCRKAAASCCAPSKCMKPARQDAAPAQAKTIAIPASPLQTATVLAAVRDVQSIAVAPSSPPPPTQRRLASLSILLV